MNFIEKHKGLILITCFFIILLILYKCVCYEQMDNIKIDTVGQNKEIKQHTILEQKLLEDSIWEVSQNDSESTYVKLSEINETNLQNFIITYKGLKYFQDMKPGYSPEFYMLCNITKDGVPTEYMLTIMSQSTCKMMHDINNGCLGDLPILLEKDVVMKSPDQYRTIFKLLKKPEDSKDPINDGFILTGIDTTGNHYLSQSPNIINNLPLLCIGMSRSSNPFVNTIQLEKWGDGILLKFNKRIDNVIKPYYVKACGDFDKSLKCNIAGSIRLCLTSDKSQALSFKFINYKHKSYNKCIMDCNKLFKNDGIKYREEVISRMLPIIKSSLQQNDIKQEMVHSSEIESNIKQ